MCVFVCMCVSMWFVFVVCGVFGVCVYVCGVCLYGAYVVCVCGTYVCMCV
jgi:hypothetical protein